MIININTSYTPGDSYDRVLAATCGTWRIAESKLLGPNGEILRKYVLSEYKGRILAVHKVSSWYRSERQYGKGSKKEGETYMGFAFEGVQAPEEIRSKFVGKSVAWAKKRGAASPVIFTLRSPKGR